MKNKLKENLEQNYTNWLCEPETPEEREALIEMALRASNWEELRKSAARAIKELYIIELYLIEREKENGDNQEEI